MAKKRMFSMDIVDSDAFLDLTPSAQALYFHLCMRADDDGFVGNAKKIIRMLDLSDIDLDLLIDRRFVLDFGNGVICIKHWWMNNTIRADRYTPTNYTDEKKRLEIKENKSYTELKTEPERSQNGAKTAPKTETERSINGNQTTTKCLPMTTTVNQTATNDNQMSTPDKDLVLGLDLGLVYNTHCERAGACTCTRVDECLELVKEVSPILFERHRLKASSDFNLGMLLRDANYTAGEIKALCEKANKTYIVQPKYKTLDLLWVLNNKAKVEAAEIIEATATVSGGNGAGRESIVSQMTRIYNRLKEEENAATS